jgi:hypothetical protein
VTRKPPLGAPGAVHHRIIRRIERKAVLVRKIIWEYFLGRFIARAQNEVRNIFSARIAEA